MNTSIPQVASKAFTAQCRKIDLLSSIPVFVLTLGYLALQFDISLDECLALSVCLASCTVLSSMLAGKLRAAHVSAVTRHLSRSADRNDAVMAEASSAFRAVVSLPVQMEKAKFLAVFLPILIVPVSMWAMDFDVWLMPARVQSLVIISLVLSLLSGMLVFYWAKWSAGQVRLVLASRVGDPDLRVKLVSRRSLRQKLLLAVALPTFSSALLIVDVVNQNLRTSDQEEAMRWAMLAVESIASADAELPLEERISNQLPAEKFWPFPLETVEMPAARPAGTLAPAFSEEFGDALDRELEKGDVTGAIVPPTGRDMGAFRMLGDGRIMISTVLRSDFERSPVFLNWAVGLVCLGLLGVVFLVGRVLSAELTGGLETLRGATRRMVAGDLTESAGYESEDELGDLGRGVDSLRSLLRMMVSQVTGAVDRAEEAGRDVVDVLTEVSATSTSQVRRIRQAGDLMAAINSRVGESTRSARNLTSVIDESSNSILELGAAGDELNETASLLTSKVDAVSNSLEQIIRSVTKVSNVKDKLSAASEETSSSMEQMASAMRTVNTSAETTADLSRQVVQKAELGQAKVVQTIEGMEAIREATDIAESVIRGLGARTSEIGGILDVIDDVADETNLLALNAAIIAAQAGEQGKAFSVVAEEIKELADRVLASTKEIGGLIRAVQVESENAIGAIEAGSASVMSGVDLSAEAGRTLEEITISSRESGTRIGEIVASVREQTKAASHVVTLMERVRDSADEIGAAATEQDQGNEIVYQSALTMREVAQQVRRTTEDQTRGFGRIRENVAGVRVAVEKITGSLGQQSIACREVTESLDFVSQGTRATEESAEKMREAMRRLTSQAEALRREMERFRV